MRNTVTGWCYCISDGAACKVGISRNPKRRLESLQTANPRRLLLVWQVWVGVFPNMVESHLHSHLTRAGRHLSGEWFKLSPAEADRLHRLAERVASRKRWYSADAKSDRESFEQNKRHELQSAVEVLNARR